MELFLTIVFFAGMIGVFFSLICMIAVGDNTYASGEQRSVWWQRALVVCVIVAFVSLLLQTFVAHTG